MSRALTREDQERLLRRLRSEDETLRAHAILQLTEDASGLAAARPALAEALGDDVPEVRRLAAWALSRIAA
jgi:HEAT repeat protein